MTFEASADNETALVSRYAICLPMCCGRPSGPPMTHYAFHLARAETKKKPVHRWTLAPPARSLFIRPPTSLWNRVYGRPSEPAARQRKHIAAQSIQVASPEA